MIIAISHFAILVSYKLMGYLFLAKKSSETSVSVIKSVVLVLLCEIVIVALSFARLYM